MHRCRLGDKRIKQIKSPLAGMKPKAMMVIMEVAGMVVVLGEFGLERMKMDSKVFDFDFARARVHGGMGGESQY